MDYYDVLGVGREATPDEVQKAYRQAAKKYHPDVNPGDLEKEKKFREATAAYEVLSDPGKRANYDARGPFDAGADYARGHAGPGGPFDAGADFFNDLFRWGNHDSTFGSASRNIQVQVRLTLREVASGCRKTVRYQRRDLCRGCHGCGGKKMDACPMCNGTGFVESHRQGPFLMSMTCRACRGRGKTVVEKCDSCLGAGVEPPTECSVTVDIPVGAKTGDQIRVDNMGEPAQRGAGHLYVVVVVEEHPLFQRAGDDLVVKVPVSYSRLVLGGKVSVPTLTGPVPVDVPEGTGSGTVARVKGKGLPNIQSGVFGDLLAVFELDVSRPTARERELIKPLADHEDSHPSKKVQEFTRLCEAS